MKKLLALATAAVVTATVAANPALAQGEAPTKPITISGSVTLVNDYRYRGVSQTDEEMAIQGGVTATHESGLYAGFWASNLAGWGQFGGANMELDLIGGFKKSFGAATVDVGLTWYMYPGGSDITDFAEPYVKVSGIVGPVSLLAGVAYAPSQEALGNWSNTPQSRLGDKEDNLYIWGDVAAAVPGTGLTVKGHVGYSDGNPGLGPNGTSIAPTGKYVDYLVGADYVISPVTLGVAYVGTDIKRNDSLYLQPNFSSTKDGSSIAAGKVLFSLTAAF
jgi:uncharacterized protein (TIGR02001 family)